MKATLTIVIGCMLGLQAVRAAEQAPRAEVDKKSAFNVEENARNPFWPIGWKPAPKGDTKTTEHAGPDIAASAFVVSSITFDQGTHFAIINGKVMREGQQFALQMGTQTYQITLKSIQDGQVILQRRDQEIVVPMRRK